MRTLPCVAMAALLLASISLTTRADDPAEERNMTHVRGTFEVQMIPQAPAEGEPESIGRMLIDKTYAGPLEGTGKGQFLGVRTPVEGSAGYVAMELVDGTLDGKSGTFVLQHSGTMNRGEMGLTLGVVPDSATGELAGLSGTMDIIIEDGQHFYEFEYALESHSEEAPSGD